MPVLYWNMIFFAKYINVYPPSRQCWNFVYCCKTWFASRVFDKKIILSFCSVFIFNVIKCHTFFWQVYLLDYVITPILLPRFNFYEIKVNFKTVTIPSAFVRRQKKTLKDISNKMFFAFSFIDVLNYFFFWREGRELTFSISNPVVFWKSQIFFSFPM